MLPAASDDDVLKLEDELCRALWDIPDILHSHQRVPAKVPGARGENTIDPPFHDSFTSPDNKVGGAAHGARHEGDLRVSLLALAEGKHGIVGVVVLVQPGDVALELLQHHAAHDDEDGVAAVHLGRGVDKLAAAAVSVHGRHGEDGDVGDGDGVEEGAVGVLHAGLADVGAEEQAGAQLEGHGDGLVGGGAHVLDVGGLAEDVRVAAGVQVRRAGHGAHGERVVRPRQGVLVRRRGRGGRGRHARGGGGGMRGRPGGASRLFVARL